MNVKPVLLAVLMASALLVGAVGAVAANGDHDHGDGGDEDGALPDWVPDVVDDFLNAVSDLVSGLSSPLGATHVGITSGR